MQVQPAQATATESHFPPVIPGDLHAQQPLAPDENQAQLDVQGIMSQFFANHQGM